MLEEKTTEAVRKRYDRIAPLYDFMQGFAERWRFSSWRALAWGKVEGVRILEVGVGTGKNFPFYPLDAEITAIDLSDKMLERAGAKAARENVKVELLQMDAQHLKFDDNTFDTVVATCVFCSVPDPVRGFEEVKRVCKPGGKVVLLEHVLSDNPLLAWLINLFNPIGVRIMGENMNRRTVENVLKAGLSVEYVTRLNSIFRLIEARKAGAISA
ncbi:MAG: class I SAM-dependent methyltransferase [Chloroflexi bacterium]|nr:class I SAM-dependent methyltransferase [Chloroflexota bacterium]